MRTSASSLSSDIVERIADSVMSTLENVRSASAVDTGSTVSIFRRVEIAGKVSVPQRCRELNAVFGRSSGVVRVHSERQTANSASACLGLTFVR